MENKKVLTIKDFTPGDTVYTLETYMGQCYDRKPIPPNIQKEEVVSIGKKYLHTAKGKYQDFDREYLREVVNFGRPKSLFPTREEVDNYLEKIELAKRLGTMSVTDMEKYSLDQLRTVKEILDAE